MWKAVTGEEPLGATGIVLGRDRDRAGQSPRPSLVTWIGEGVITGVCLTAGLGFRPWVPNAPGGAPIGVIGVVRSAAGFFFDKQVRLL